MENSSNFYNYLFRVKLSVPLLSMSFIPVGSVNNSAIEVDRPNIIIIMADDLGYGDIGCYGNDHIKTPVLNKMAEEGITFTDFYSNGPVCTPTRAALITGNYQQRAGLEGVLYVAIDQRKYGISTSEITMAELFSESGYKTGLFGKWHLGYKPENNPVNHGFDEFYGFISGNIDYISHRDGANIHDWWHNTDTIHEKGYLTDLITDKALSFMDNRNDNPFLLYLSHAAPHFPFQGRNDKADRLPGKNFESHGSRPDKKQAYKEMVEIMDENIGRVFRKVKELGLEEKTFIFFFSDNGALNLGSNGDLKGFKTSLWEGGIRVPAIVWYPEKINGGTSTTSPVLTMDILPTLLSVAGIEHETQFDGKDFSEVLFSQKEMEERPLFWRYRNQWAVRKGNWKYLRIDEDEYLFDLVDDIQETINLKDTYPGVILELKNLLTDWENEMAKYEQITN